MFQPFSSVLHVINDNVSLALGEFCVCVSALFPPVGCYMRTTYITRISYIHASERRHYMRIRTYYICALCVLVRKKGGRVCLCEFGIYGSNVHCTYTDRMLVSFHKIGSFASNPRPRYRIYTTHARTYAYLPSGVSHISLEYFECHTLSPSFGLFRFALYSQPLIFRRFWQGERNRVDFVYIFWP